MKRWLFAVVAILLHLVLPQSWVEVLAVAAVLTLGLAHGAVDPLLARGGESVTFYLTYLAAAVAVLVAWWLSPTVALLGLLAASVVHFGNGDARGMACPSSSAIFARGLMVVFLPLVLHTAEVAPIIVALGVPAPTWGPIEGAGLAIPLVVWNVLAARRRGTFAVADVVVLALSFAILPPLVSFSLYFTAWHAVDHFLDLRHLDAAKLARRAVLGCVISWTAIALFAWATARWVAPEARWAVVFGFLSAVPAPHMIVVARARLALHRTAAPASSADSRQVVGATQRPRVPPHRFLRWSSSLSTNHEDANARRTAGPRDETRGAR